MSSVTAQDVQHYLSEHNYVKLDELALRAYTTPDQSRELEDAQCIPAASDVVEGEMTFTSTFGTYRLPVEPERYYHPSIERWIGEALLLVQDRNLSEVAEIVRSEFNACFTEALRGNSPPWPGGSDYAWNYITDGTWGLCLKDITVVNLLAKEFARATIRQIVSPDPGHELTSDERDQLKAAIIDYQEVALPFAPHEVDESSTRLEVQPAMEKYNIQIEAEIF